MSTSPSVTEQYRCDECNRTLTDERRYKIHLGTKGHKKNIKIARKAFYEPGAQRSSIDSDTPASPTAEGAPLELSDLTGINDYKGERKRYHQKATVSYEEYYISYVSSSVAYWAIKLAMNPTVDDFKISINDKSWALPTPNATANDFGDAVVEIQFKDLPGKPSMGIRCAINFKQISYNVRSLVSFEVGKFGFEGIAKQVGKLKGKEPKDLEDTKFIVFTTSTPDPSLKTALKLPCCPACHKPKVTCKCSVPGPDKCDQQEENISVYARTFSNRRNLDLNTSEDNETIYRFYPEDNSYHLPQIYIYSCQKKLRNFPDAINEILLNSLTDMRPQIARDFIKYIENWGKGKCGGYFKLSKEDVMVKLGQLLLTPLRITPKVNTVDGEASRYAIWVQAVKSADITILDTSANLSELLEPFTLLVEKELALKINTRHDTIRIIRDKDATKDDTTKVQNAILRSYLVEESLKDRENDIPLERVLLMFWKAGLVPLSLQVENENDLDYVCHVMKLLNDFGLTRRYLVKTNNVDVHNFTIQKFKPLSFFSHLHHISDKLGPKLLSNIKINVTSNLSLSLTDIEKSDAFFKRTITANELFDMVLGKCSFKPVSYWVRQGVDEHTTLTLDDNVFDAFRRAVESKNNMSHMRRNFQNDVVDNNRLRGIDPNWFDSRVSL